MRPSSGYLDDPHDLAPALGFERDLPRQRTLAQGPFLRPDSSRTRWPLLLPLMGLVEITKGHRLDVRHQVALRRRAGECGIEYVPVLAPQGPVLQEVRHPLQPRALQAGRVRPATPGEGDDR